MAGGGASVVYKTDVLVIGSGLAGIRAAVAAQKCGADVILVSKGTGASPDIIGFNAAVADKDTSDIHYEDTINSGMYINNKSLVKRMSKEAVLLVDELEAMGVGFDRSGSDYRLLQPLGSSYPRLVHHRSNTAIQVVKIIKKSRAWQEVKTLNNLMITDLLTDGKRIVGACGIDMNMGGFVGFQAKAIVLAAGGSGGLHHFTTYPSDINGMGYALAFNAGAEMVDMEFIQFEPCGFVAPKSLIGKIIVTTLLMAGAELLNNTGERFMFRYSDRGEKVQKDVLSRAMYNEISQGRGSVHGGIYIDVTKLPTKLLVEDQDRYYQSALKAGVDLTKSRGEVAPIAHTFLGGVRIDENCASSVEGLYAAGEVSGGLHGANRIGGNAGTEVLVFGPIAGINAANYVNHMNQSSIEPAFRQGYSEKRREFELRKSAKKSSVTPMEVRNKIGSIISREIGIVKSGEGLTKALGELEEISQLVPVMHSEELNQLSEIYIVNGMLISAKMMIKASLIREESRGAHYRKDYPETNNNDWLKNIIIKRSEDGLTSTISPVLEDTDMP